MDVPQGRHYTSEHEWLRLDEESVATVGITDFAQESLGDITFVELPQEGDEIKKNDAFGVVESVKAVSDLYAPITGRVLEVNQPLLQSPDLLNQDPYNDAWLIKLEFKGEAELDGLMSPEQYQQYIEEKT